MFWCCCGRCLLPAVPFDYGFQPWIQNGDYPKVAWCLWCHTQLWRPFFFFANGKQNKTQDKKMQLYSLYWATISNTSLQLGKKKFYPMISTIWRGGYDAMDLHSFYPQVPSNWTAAISESWKFSKSDATRPYETFCYMQFWHQRLESFVAVIGGEEKVGVLLWSQAVIL